MQLTCPTCQSGLQVPDGTTAHVRCPTCKSVFPAEEGLAPPTAPVLAPPPLPKPPPRPALPVDDDRPHQKKRRQKSRDEDQDEEEDDHRDGVADAGEKPKPRRRVSDKKLSPEERRKKLAEFHMGMYGARIIQISLLFYIPGVLFVPLHQIVSGITKADVPFILVIAGIFGLVNWVLGAIGICLCLAGPKSPGHLGFGVSAIVVAGVHAVFLFVVVVKTNANADFRGLDRGSAMWAQIATQYESLSFYLSFLLYPDDIPLRRSDTILSFLTGVLEMTRLILFLMALGCLAQAGGDRELSERCTRMAGRVAIIPGLLALGMLAYKIVAIETGAGSVPLFIGFLNYLYRSITLVVAGILGMTTRTVGEVVEVCEFPYQGEVNLGASNESVSFYD